MHALTHTVLSVHESVPDAHTQCRHPFLTHMINIILKALFKFGIFTHMLSIHLRNWCICSGDASVPDVYAQQTHQFLTPILRVRISPCCICSACFEGTVLLKMRLSRCVRNFAAPKKPLNICLKKCYFKPKVTFPQRLYGVKIMKIRAIENLTLGHL